MQWSKRQFQEWGAKGGRMASRRLTKAQRRARAKKAVNAREAYRVTKRQTS